MLVSGNDKFDAITAGSQTTCALTPDNQAWCWGSSGRNGRAEDIDVSTAIGGGHAFTALSASLWHTDGLDNQYLQLGTGQQGTNNLPQVVLLEGVLESPVSFFSLGDGYGYHTCAIGTRQASPGAEPGLTLAAAGASR